MDKNDNRQSFMYSNETSNSIEIILEPWGELYIIESGTDVQIIGTGGESEKFFEIHQNNGGIIIFAWPGSIVHILQNGFVLKPSDQK